MEIPFGTSRAVRGGYHDEPVHAALTESVMHPVHEKRATPKYNEMRRRKWACPIPQP
jgi:hypothetical protein